jgi:hypothetical protein
MEVISKYIDPTIVQIYLIPKPHIADFRYIVLRTATGSYLGYAPYNVTKFQHIDVLYYIAYTIAHKWKYRKFSHAWCDEIHTRSDADTWRTYIYSSSCAPHKMLGHLARWVDASRAYNGGYRRRGNQMIRRRIPSISPRPYYQVIWFGYDEPLVVCGRQLFKDALWHGSRYDIYTCYLIPHVPRRFDLYIEFFRYYANVPRVCECLLCDPHDPKPLATCDLYVNADPYTQQRLGRVLGQPPQPSYKTIDALRRRIERYIIRDICTIIIEFMGVVTKIEQIS